MFVRMGKLQMLKKKEKKKKRNEDLRVKYYDSSQEKSKNKT